jgi:putative ATP-dependent endonuclease of OLD family
MGQRVGSWPVQLLATAGFELVSQVAVLTDTDLRGDPLPDPKPPVWQAAFRDDTVRFFWSRPTLEPTLVEGNEEHIETALMDLNLDAGVSPPTPGAVDALFHEDPGKSRKAEFALALAAELESSDNGTVPEHIASMFEWLFDGMTRAVTLAQGGGTGAADADEPALDDRPGGTINAPD